MVEYKILLLWNGIMIDNNIYYFKFISDSQIDHFRRRYTEMDMRIVTDWQALTTWGLEPSYKSTADFGENPFRDLLDNWLVDLKLAYRVVDAHTIQISSEDAINNLFEIELYRIASEPGMDEAKLINDIKTLLADRPLSVGESILKTIAYDKPSRCLLVALPQPQQRFLARWLSMNKKLDTGKDDADD